MFPWLFVWCPQWHFPLSGGVQQHFRPEMFFGAIPAQSGNGKIEAEVFESVASYGKQLGILSDLVLSLADPTALPPDEAAHALAQLRQLRAKIMAIKSGHTPPQG